MDPKKIQDYLKQGFLISPDLEDIPDNPEQFDSEAVLTPEAVSSPSQQYDGVEIIRSFKEESGERKVRDFIDYFLVRFKGIEGLLRNRQELRMATAIRRVITRKERAQAAIIGMIREKKITKNKNILLVVEDTTGKVTVLVSKSKHELFTFANTLCLDEVVGIVGVYDSILYADQVIIPDVPLDKEFVKSPVEEAMVVIGDLHVGAENFLQKEFVKYVHWLQGKVGTEEQRALAKKVKYVVVVGDLVEGVGIFPGQEKETNILDVHEQYNVFTEYLKEIPSHIQIIICPGNHDVGRLAEPQPKIYKDYAESLYALPNVHMVSNPAYIRIGRTATFPGFVVLMYHGGSLIYYSDEVEEIRAAGGQKRVDLVMQYLLQRRHLAPTHNATLYVPYKKQDPLFIDIVPDFFVTGHIHRASITQYRNVTLINSSGWVKNTEYQEKRGLEPILSRAIVVNLHTRETRVMNFESKT